MFAPSLLLILVTVLVITWVARSHHNTPSTASPHPALPSLTLYVTSPISLFYDVVQILNSRPYYFLSIFLIVFRVCLRCLQFMSILIISNG